MRVEPPQPCFAVPWRFLDGALIASSVGWFLVALVPLSNVTVGVDAFLLLAAGFSLVGLLWIVCAGSLLARSQGRRRARAWAAVCVLPVAVVAAFGLSGSDALFRARLALSDDDLAAYAAAYEGSGELHEPGRRVGLFGVETVTLESGGCVLLETAEGFATAAGIAYCDPGEEPQQTSLTSFRQIRDQWWTWERRFH